MKSILILALAFAFVGATSIANAQRFAITKHTIDSGGGTSTGGKYSITGTIGQPDASGVSTGANYTVSGGYWGGKINIVNTPGAPELKITKVGKNSITLSWSDPNGVWELAQSTTMQTAAWARSNLQSQNTNGTTTVTIDRPAKAQYFRLQRKP